MLAERFSKERSQTLFEVFQLVNALTQKGRRQWLKSSAAEELLQVVFSAVNREYFEGYLPLPRLYWNTRLRTSAGRFRTGSRQDWEHSPPAIEVASYLLEEENACHLVLDTVAHEMIHFWLWYRRRPYGHTREFYAKMREMGATRYNTVPRRRPYRYLYFCPNCETEYPARKKLGRLACRKCCQAYTGGYYDPRFRLIFKGEYQEASESKEPQEERVRADTGVDCS